MKRVTVHLTEVQIKDLRTEATDRGVSVAEVIRRAVELYLLRKVNVG